MFMDAIHSLKEDHQRLRQIFSKLKETTGTDLDARKKLLGALEMESKIHSKLEEEIFYPAFYAAVSLEDDKHLFFRATEEHHAFDTVLVELMITRHASEQFLAKVEVLEALAENHIGHEEKDMFTVAERVMGVDGKFADLKDKMEKRRRTLTAQWNSPYMRPIKKIQSALEGFVPSRLKSLKGKASGASAAES